MVEEFGVDVEEFGAGEEPAEQPEDRALLLRMYDEFGKQIAATMDDVERQRLRNARKECMAKLTNKAESQWTDMARAYGEFFNDAKLFAKRLEKLGGLSDEAFETLRSELSQAHAEKEAKAKKGGGKRGGKKADAKAKEDAPQAVAPDERFQAIVKHAENLGLEAQTIWDELFGNEPISDERLDAFLAVVNERGAAEPVSIPTANGGADSAVEEFGADTTDGDRPEPVPAQKRHLISDASFDGLVDPETGEVVKRSWVLDVLGWADFPTEPSREQLDRIVDVMHTRWLDPAQRYRAQAEKLAGPLEKRAAIFESIFGDYIDACGDAFLPRVQKGENAGKFTKKTLDLPSGSISWTKEGGSPVCDEGTFRMWLEQKRQEMLVLREQGTPEALEELKALEDKYGLKLKTVAEASKALIKELPVGWEPTEADEFARRTIK
jgi:hypothetical protein